MCFPEFSVSAILTNSDLGLQDYNKSDGLIRTQFEFLKTVDEKVIKES